MDIIWTVLSSLHFESTTFFCQIALFFFLHYSLNFLVYQPIMSVRDLRDKKIASNLAAAEAATEAARRVKEEYEGRVRSARSDGQSALAQATAVAEAERKARVEKAREQAGAVLESAKAEAEATREKAEAGIDAQSEAVARTITAKLLTGTLGDVEGGALLARIGGGRS